MISFLSLFIPICGFITPTKSFHAVHVASTMPRSLGDGYPRCLLSQLRADATGGSAEDMAVESPSQPTSEDESDIMNSPAFLRRKADVLKSDIAAIEKENEEANVVYEEGKEEWGSMLDDLQKESLLMQERMSRQGREASVEATQDVVTKILNVIDNYDRAWGTLTISSDEEKEIAEAYTKTYDTVIDVFAGFNVTKVETVGAEFDYELHQALMTVASEDYSEGTVCQELATGWVMGEKLIRPAMVAVAA